MALRGARSLICKIDPFRSIPPPNQTTVFKRTVATLGRVMGRKDWIIGSLEGFQRGVQGDRARGGGSLRDMRATFHGFPRLPCFVVYQLSRCHATCQTALIIDDCDRTK